MKRILKKKLVVILVIALLIGLLYLWGVRIRTPFGAFFNQRPESISIYPYDAKDLFINNPELINEIYTILDNLKVTTTGLSVSFRMGMGIIITTDSYKFVFFDDKINFRGLRYRVSDEGYLDEIRKILDRYIEEDALQVDK